MAKLRSMANGTTLTLLLVKLHKVGISYLMAVKFIMMLIEMAMVKVCYMACKRWETITTTSTWAMVRKKVA